MVTGSKQHRVPLLRTKPPTEVPLHLLAAKVLKKPWENVEAAYSLERELGRGQFGVTRLCTSKSNGRAYACKTIAKRNLKSQSDVDDVLREVQIMHHLASHENIVELIGAYEDRRAVHLVMELCEGGELFDRIVARGRYTEQDAASLCKTIVKVVQICHSLGVMHRDIKPENFLFTDTTDDAVLKVTDFGMSVFFKPGQVFEDRVGSPYYVAPEVLKHNYGPEADVWSAGVVLYILLCGVPPFWAKSKEGIFEAIVRGNIDFESEPWPSVSAAAKDLVKKMLTQDPKERITAAEVLKDSWIGDAPDAPLDNAILSRLKQFAATNKLKQLALRVIADSLSEEEIVGLKEMFIAMDTDSSGAITFEELKDGLARLGSNLEEPEVRELMEAADVDRNGSIDYLEFLSATMHMNKTQKQGRLHAAFQYFDTDNSGYITVEELETALARYGMCDPGTIPEILKDVDTDNDGKINYDEFEAMMTLRGPKDPRTTISLAMQ